MKFRKGGYLARTDEIYFGMSKLEFVNQYNYLGIIVHYQLSFTAHVQAKKRKSLAVIASLDHLALINIDTALKIYEMKILPTVTYLFEVIGPFLTKPHLLQLDVIKSVYF